MLPEPALNENAGDQVYVLAPEAVKIAELPAQMVALLTLTVGFGVTLTFTVLVAIVAQPDKFPLTV